MRRTFPITACVLLALLAGCSSTGRSRLGANTGSRSIAVVGDRPMPATSGEPGTQVAAEAPDPEPRRNPKARISGRVVDDQGRPVSGITVRLADGASKGGKDIRATTDRSGAFTLNGLRPGSAYSLVAEADDDRGRLSGRAEAEASETGVEISLTSADEANAARNRSGRATRARPISSQEESEKPLEPEDSPSINREDLRPADEASDPDLDRRPSSGRPRLSAPEPTVGWRKKGATTRQADPSEADVESVASSATDETPTRTRRSSGSGTEPEDDGQNPLPPAINRRRAAPVDDDSQPQASLEPNPPRKVSDRSGSKPRDLGALTLAPEAPEDRTTPPETLSADPRRKTAASGLPEMPPLLPEVASRPRSIEVAGTPSLEPGPDLGDHQEARPAIALGADPRVDPPPIAGVDPPGATASPPMGMAISQVDSHTIPASEPVFASTPQKAEDVPKLPPGQDYNPFLLVSDHHGGSDRSPGEAGRSAGEVGRSAGEVGRLPPPRSRRLPRPHHGRSGASWRRPTVRMSPSSRPGRIPRS